MYSIKLCPFSDIRRKKYHRVHNIRMRKHNKIVAEWTLWYTLLTFMHLLSYFPFSLSLHILFSFVLTWTYSNLPFNSLFNYIWFFLVPIVKNWYFFLKTPMIYTNCNVIPKYSIKLPWSVVNSFNLHCRTWIYCVQCNKVCGTLILKYYIKFTFIKLS